MTFLSRMAFLLLLIIVFFHFRSKTETFNINWIVSSPQQILPDDITGQIDEKELECLQRNIYFEAGNQGKLGKEAVALVTLNRVHVKHFPDTVCGVVYQRKQFSWTISEKKPKLNNVLEKKQWDVSGEIAKAALRGELDNFIGKATHYHADYVNPTWANSKRMKYVTTIGKHLFYRDVKLDVKSS